VLDDDDGVAVVGEAVEDIDEFALVLGVEPGGGLVQEIERLAGVLLAEFLGEFNAGPRRLKRVVEGWPSVI